MSVIFNRLERSLNLSLRPGESLTEHFRNRTPELNAELVIQHAQINIEYAVLCSQITCEWSNNHTPAFRQNVEHALETAGLLEIIYDDYLDLPREVERLRKEQRFMRAWLNRENIDTTHHSDQSYIEEDIHKLTVKINLPRLFLLRTKRLLMAIVPLTATNSSYYRTMKAVDPYLAPLFSHVAWCIFIPRIACHLFLILKHTIEHDGMSNEEKAMGVANRLSVQLMARWVDLTNDIPWLMANCVSCFLLVGPLLPYNIVLSIAMQFYEIAQSMLIYLVELHHLHEQQKHYINARDAQPAGSEAYLKFNNYLVHLGKRIDYESARLFIPVVNTTILLLAIVLAAPIFTPACAVAGGAIAVSSTIGTWFVKNYYVESPSTKPPNHLFQLLENAAHASPHQNQNDWGFDNAP